MEHTISGLHYGKHALLDDQYSPTKEDPFRAPSSLSYRAAKADAQGGYVDTFIVVGVLVGRAATRAVLGMTGGHRADELDRPATYASHDHLPHAGFHRAA